MSARFSGGSSSATTAASTVHGSACSAQLTTGGGRRLDPAEPAAAHDEFGVADEQVLRDHAISHVLGAPSGSDLVDDLLVIGGTALSRTFLPRRRLSRTSTC